MLRALRQAWKNYISSLPKSQIVDSIPPSQWNQDKFFPQVSKANSKTFAELLEIVYEHLPPNDAAKLLAERSLFLKRGVEIESALAEALIPTEEDEPENLGFIACDWTATDEVKWQADILCRAHGIPTSWQTPPGSLTSVLQGLGDWLRVENLQLFCFSVGDSVVAFAVPASKAAAVAALGEKLKIALSTTGEA